MGSLLNRSRPPVFCPGCAHERVVAALDRALANLGLGGEQVAIVSDIGCSGLFDTFFDTHALHGLHGRALTYATGIKLARPELHVIVTMGDGGLGIGGAHVLSTCRRNIDLTLLVLNNFNYGMTGGQCSSTTPADASVSSGFLNRIERPVDICQLTGTAGAGFVARGSAYQQDLPAQIEAAMRFEGFSVVDIWGICPGRYTKRNKLTPKLIEDALEQMPPLEPFAALNARGEYGRRYREEAARMAAAAPPAAVEARCSAPGEGRREVVILGAAGQRVITAGEIVCLAGAVAGLHATQKNEYPITVLRGHSVSELILSEKEIGYTGIDRPSAVIALAPEGTSRRRGMLARVPHETRVIRAAGVDLSDCGGTIETHDFKALRIKPADWALAALAVLAAEGTVISREMLEAALGLRFSGNTLSDALGMIDRVIAGL